MPHSMASRHQTMTNHIVIECKSAEDAEVLRNALRRICGLEVEEEIFAKAGPDLRKLVCFVAATTAIASASVSAIISELAALGYTEINISGKIVALNLVSLEGVINAKKADNQQADHNGHGKP